MSSFSMRWAAPRAALGLALLVASCNPAGMHRAPGLARDCTRWEEGCACDPGSAPVRCEQELGRLGNEVSCGVGTRTCVDGAWSACEITERHLGVTRQALSSTVTQCSTCKPYCATVATYPTAVDDLTDENAFNIQIDPLGGVSLAVPPAGGGSVCVGGGPGCTGFDLSMGDGSGMMSTGLSLADNGNIVLTNPDSTGAGSGSSLAGSVFISNTGDGTVSRYDYETLEETGRWWTCPAMNSDCDPSRTSVNTRGDAFVANRGKGDYNSVMRISNLGTACPDTTGPAGVPDGVIKTWVKGGKPLPWVKVGSVWKTTDDCVLWYKDVGAIGVEPMVRGIAAQDLTNDSTGELEEYVWVGGHDANKSHGRPTGTGYLATDHPSTTSTTHTNRVALLDGKTGNLLRLVATPAGTYGMALDRTQNVWMLEKGTATNALMRLDTTRCHADSCPTLTWCASGAGLATDCDSEIAEKITVTNSGYGITVDYKQRVWINDGKLTSYDRSLSRGTSSTTPKYIGRFKTAYTSSGGGGVTADSKGWIWACAKSFVLRVKGDAPDLAANNHKVVDQNGAIVDCNGKGIAVDTAGRIWTIPSTALAGQCQTP